MKFILRVILTGIVAMIVNIWLQPYPAQPPSQLALPPNAHAEWLENDRLFTKLENDSALLRKDYYNDLHSTF